MEARWPDFADFRRWQRLPCVSSICRPVCVSGSAIRLAAVGEQSDQGDQRAVGVQCLLDQALAASLDLL